MLVGVDTAPYLWGGVVLIPVLRVGSSPTSIPEFRNSGFRMCLLSLGALVELLLLHIMLYMRVLPGPWCPSRTASDHMCDMMCFLALGVSRRIASVHLSCNMFMPSTPELLNSGMLAGVDTSLYLWGVSCYLFSGWCVHPRAFLNSGIRDSLIEQPTFWQHTAIVLTCRAKGRSTVLGGP